MSTTTSSQGPNKDTAIAAIDVLATYMNQIVNSAEAEAAQAYSSIKDAFKNGWASGFRSFGHELGHAVRGAGTILGAVITMVEDVSDIINGFEESWREGVRESIISGFSFGGSTLFGAGGMLAGGAIGGPGGGFVGGILGGKVGDYLGNQVGTMIADALLPEDPINGLYDFFDTSVGNAIDQSPDDNDSQYGVGMLPGFLGNGDDIDADHGYGASDPFGGLYDFFDTGIGNAIDHSPDDNDSYYGAGGLPGFDYGGDIDADDGYGASDSFGGLYDFFDTDMGNAIDHSPDDNDSQYGVGSVPSSYGVSGDADVEDVYDDFGEYSHTTRLFLLSVFPGGGFGYATTV